MTIGILGHAARFLVFALAPFPAVAIVINMLHGICYAFFFATVYIFVDEFFPKDARSSAQGLFNFLILGAGPFLGNFLWARLGVIYSVGKDAWNFHQLFLVPAGIALGAAVFLLLFFHPPEKAHPGLVEEMPRPHSGIQEPETGITGGKSDAIRR
jgi:MFS family permease